MTQGARLWGAGPRARLPERAGDDPAGAVAVRGATGRSGPERTCVGCRGRGSRSALVRVVRVEQDGHGDTDRATLDPRRSMPGRGAWLHADPDCLALAERRRALARALRVAALDVSGLRAELDEHLGTSGPRSGSPTWEAGQTPMGTR